MLEAKKSDFLDVEALPLSHDIQTYLHGLNDETKDTLILEMIENLIDNRIRSVQRDQTGIARSIDQVLEFVFDRLQC